MQLADGVFMPQKAEFLEKEKSQMTKYELITAASGATSIPPQVMGKALNAALDIIIDAVGKGDTITLPGFGTFSRKHRPAGTCRNPRTGASMEFPARNVASFKPGKWLREAVNAD